SNHQPWAGVEEILAADFGKGCLDPRVGNPGHGHDLPRISAPHEAEFLFTIHLPFSVTRNYRWQMRAGPRRLDTAEREIFKRLLSRSAPEGRIWNSTRC